MASRACWRTPRASAPPPRWWPGRPTTRSWWAREAKNQAVTNPENTITAVKRLIGHLYNDEAIKHSREMAAFQVIMAKNGDAWIKAGGEEMSPQQVSAQVLMKMKKTAEDYLGEAVTKAVITVPAYFDDAQRQATISAGRIAGLEVERIINEPTAAALAYGLDRDMGGSKTIAVYDLGGGTFDISVIKITQGDDGTQFEVLSTAGDTHLGGEDLDREIVNWLIAGFKDETGMDIGKDLVVLQRLKEAAEAAKIELSFAQEARVDLPFIAEDKNGEARHLQRTMTRTELEELTGGLIEKTMGPVRQALEDALLKASDIDEVLLVGGQTRMDLVRRKVTEYFGRQPRQDINPDEAVAAGASIQSGLLGSFRPDVELLDVTPLTLNVETLGDVATPIIKRNTSVPVRRVRDLTTVRDNQKAVQINVWQGERKRASDNRFLGKFRLTGISRGLLRGEVRVEVMFDIDADGILRVMARDKNTGAEKSMEIQGSSGLSEEEVREMIVQARLNEAEDRVFNELAKPRNEANQMIHEADRMLRELGENANESSKSKVRNSMARLRELVASEDGRAMEKETGRLADLVRQIGG